MTDSSNLMKGLNKEDHNTFEKIWEKYDDGYKAALGGKNVDAAHNFWCDAATKNLYSKGKGAIREVPAGRPKRGRTLPRKQVAATAKYSSFTGRQQDVAADMAADICGLIRDIEQRAMRVSDSRNGTWIMQRTDDHAKVAHIDDKEHRRECTMNDNDATTMDTTIQRLDTSWASS